MKMTGKGIFLRILIPFWYRLMCCFSGKPDRVLFLEIRYGDVTDNLRLLKAAYEKEGGHKTAVYLLRTGEGSGFSFVLRCFGMLRALAKAKLVYVDESSDILAAVPVRRETAVIQCWHACGAFKRFGHGSGPLPREYYGPYAFVTVSSPDIVADYMDAMNQPAEKVLPLGVSRTDRFFDQAFLEAARKKVRALDPALSSRRILLYAPTFRGNVADAKMPPLPDFEKLKAALSKECVLLYKGHPSCSERPDFGRDLADFCFDVTDRFSIEELLATADYCVTDYSSLVFEFALFERPILFYVPDLAQYGDERGFYHTIAELDAGEVCTDTAALAAAVLDEVTSGPEGMKPETCERIKAFRRRFMESCDGHATERIMAKARELF